MGTLVPSSVGITLIEKQRLGYFALSLTNFATQDVPQIVGNVEVAGALYMFSSPEDISGISDVSAGLVYIKLIPTLDGTISAQWTGVAPEWDDEKQGWYSPTLNEENQRYVFSAVKIDNSNVKDKTKLEWQTTLRGDNWRTALTALLGANWPTALAAALGTNWTTALAAALGTNWTTALAATAGSGILTELKKVDGAGSGLDADSVDGQHPFSTLSPNTIVSRDANSRSYVSPVITSGSIGSAGVVGELRLVNSGHPAYTDRLYIYVQTGLVSYAWRAVRYLDD